MTPGPGAAAELSAALGHTFSRPALLEEALTHASVGESVSYERLEFLGDRVLGLVVAEMLLDRFPDEPEGDIAKRHAALVNRDSLARVAADIDLGRFLVLSPGEAEGGGRANPALLADACEAVIAALYLDGGLAAARRFVERHWRPLAAVSAPPRDAKTALQEWAQRSGRPLPVYTLVATEGPPHEPRFTVEARVEGVPAARGAGASKRTAEQAAATALLDRIARGRGA